jgi:hypothetical protein
MAEPHLMVDASIDAAVVEALRSELRNHGQVRIHVSGSCMEPVITDSSRLTLSNLEGSLPGDILVYHSPHERNDEHKNFVHRYLGKTPAGQGRWKYLLIADNGTRPDTLVDPENIIGRVCEIDGVDVQVSTGRRLMSITKYIGIVSKLSVNRLLRLQH